MDRAYVWVYDTRHRTKNERFDMTVRVEGEWKDGATNGLILTQEDPRGRMREYLLRTDRGWGMARVAIKRAIAPEVSTRFEPPMPRMMFPVQPGSTLHWEGQLKIGWIDRKIVFDGEVAGWEDVTVPAGTFRCVRLHFVEKRGDEPVEEDVWYAPGVGQVKYSGSNYIKELKSLKKP
jgi:hypothetical protein